MESISSYLKRERELRQISLEEIATQSNIRLDFLKAIEEEHFERLPGLTFVRGYLRNYAAYIGLNPDEVLVRFESYLQGLSGASRWGQRKSRTELLSELISEELPRQRKKILKPLLIFLGIIALLILFFSQ